MEPVVTHSAFAYLQILLLLVFLLPAVLFILTQQNTLKLIQPLNRKMAPGQVWLQLIPIYGFLQMFTVVARISGSIQREFDSYFNDSSSVLPDASAVGGKRPLYSIGMTYCWLFVIFVLSGYLLPFSLQLMRGLLGLASTLCWIIYWVQLAGYKKRLQALRPA
jgi:hypothetical protein